MTDLFDNEHTPIFDKYKGRHNAHPAKPGTGPDGETCKTCRYRLSLDYHDTMYFKCELANITHGPGTDLRLKDEACEMWAEVKKYE